MAEAKKSNFSVTCSRLSQFLKDNRRSFGDHDGEIGRKPVPQITEFREHVFSAAYRPPPTLNLLAGLEASDESRADMDDTGSVSDRNAAKEAEPESAPLTIFYNGKVIVIDNFSPEKAADIMNLAMKESSAAVSSAAEATRFNASGNIIFFLHANKYSLNLCVANH